MWYRWYVSHTSTRRLRRKVKKVKMKCKFCGKEFEAIRRSAKYCGESCRNKATYRRNHQREIQRTCEICGKEFQTTKGYQKYCSKECSEQAWKQNMSDIMKRYYRSHYDEKYPVKSRIVKKYKGTCQICGSMDHEKFAVHHIIPRRLGGEDTEDNLTYLCNSCHHKLHQAIIKAIIDSVPKEKQIEIIKQLTSERIGK